VPLDLIDTHCHLNSEEDFPDPASAIAEARGAGVNRLILIGVDPANGRRAIEIAETHEGVYAVVGHHPNYTQNYSKTSIDELRVMLGHPKCLALGEIGLDFHWDYATREQQERALYDQLDLADELGMPVVFHCREAYPELLGILESRPVRPYLFHCFSGNREDAERAVALGCYFGIDGPITYKESDQLRELAKWLPLDKLVLETDSPYMSPVPFRGKPNKPAYLPFINAALAAAIGISEEECGTQTTKNAQAFFKFA